MRMFEEPYCEVLACLKPEFLHDNDRDVEDLAFIDDVGTDDDV